MAHYRFNRHQLFTMDDTSEVMSIIREVRDISMDVTNPAIEVQLDELTNMLYGLFDGYLYDNVLTTAASIVVLDMVLIRRIEAIVDMVTIHILAQGESVTNV
jgi:hypothetical protein